jgi:hypothetical protein
MQRGMIPIEGATPDSDGSQMRDYQLYIRDGYGELLGSALQFRASSDAAAIAEAAILRKHFTAELRDGPRLVKRFESAGTNRP